MGYKDVTNRVNITKDNENCSIKEICVQLYSIEYTLKHIERCFNKLIREYNEVDRCSLYPKLIFTYDRNVISTLRDTIDTLFDEKGHCKMKKLPANECLSNNTNRYVKYLISTDARNEKVDVYLNGILVKRKTDLTTVVDAMSIIGVSIRLITKDVDCKSIHIISIEE